MQGFVEEICYSGSVDMIQELIEKRGKEYVIDARCCKPYYFTCLHKAANGGNVDVIKLLLDGGTDVEKPSAYGWIALHFAETIQTDRTNETVSLLLDRGANNENRTKKKMTCGFIICNF